MYYACKLNGQFKGAQQPKYFKKKSAYNFSDAQNYSSTPIYNRCLYITVNDLVISITHFT